MTLIAEVNEITSGLSLLVAIPFKSFREIVQELLCWHALMQELNVTMPGTSDAWDACSMMEMAHCHSLAFSHTLIALLKVIRLGVTSHLLASCRIWIPNCHRESIALIRVFKLTTSGKSFRVEVAEFSGFSKSWKSCTATCHCPAVALAAIAALMHTMSAWSETSLIWKSKASASSQRPSPSNDLMAALYAISFDATPSASSMDDNTLKAAFHSCARLQDLIAAPYVTSLIGICRAFIRSMRCRACVHPPAVEPVLPMTALKWKVFTSTSLAERKSKILTASWRGSKCLRESTHRATWCSINAQWFLMCLFYWIQTKQMLSWFLHRCADLSLQVAEGWRFWNTKYQIISNHKSMTVSVRGPPLRLRCFDMQTEF